MVIHSSSSTTGQAHDLDTVLVSSCPYASPAARAAEMRWRSYACSVAAAAAHHFALRFLIIFNHPLQPHVRGDNQPPAWSNDVQYVHHIACCSQQTVQALKEGIAVVASQTQAPTAAGSSGTTVEHCER
jgi:hypothetical protein